MPMGAYLGPAKSQWNKIIQMCNGKIELSRCRAVPEKTAKYVEFRLPNRDEYETIITEQNQHIKF